MSNTVSVHQIEVGDRARTDLGDLTDLTASIKEVGLLQPPVVTSDYKLIAGGRRLEACRRLGMDHVPVVVAEHITDAVALLKAERDENTCRKAMTASELIALGRQIEALEKPKARERMSEAGKSAAPGAPAQRVVPANEPFSRRVDSRERAAEAVGLSSATYSRIKQIANEADGYRIDRGQQTPVGEQRQAESREALALIDRITAGEEIRPTPDARPLTVTAVYEQWKGHKVNRGEGAPPERRHAPAPAAPPLKNAYGRRYPQRTQRKALTEGMAALSGLCTGLASVTELDDALNAGEAAQWRRDLNQALRVLRSLDTKLKEHINGKR